MLDLKIINGTLVIPGTGKVRAGVGVKDGKVMAIDAEDKLGDATRHSRRRRQVRHPRGHRPPRASGHLHRRLRI